MIKLFYPQFWQNKNIIAYLLWPLSLVYASLGYARKILVSTIILPAKVICVGNATVGGTGKTQVVIWLAQLFKARNINFVIISKGYGSTLTKASLVKEEHMPREVGDEAVMLFKYGPVIATPKVAQALSLVYSLKPQVVIIDDGMQNPAFHKDLNILVIDGERKFGNGFLLPAGPLRQTPKQAIAEADVSILTAYEKIKNIGQFSTFFSSKPLFIASIEPVTVLDSKKKYLAFCGIGNPERFFNLLKNQKLSLAKCKIYPDHYNYTSADLAWLRNTAKKLNSILITTRKDYVKISRKLPVTCFDVTLSIPNQSKLIELIDEKIF